MMLGHGAGVAYMKETCSVWLPRSLTGVAWSCLSNRCASAGRGLLLRPLSWTSPGSAALLRYRMRTSVTCHWSLGAQYRRPCAARTYAESGAKGLAGSGVSCGHRLDRPLARGTEPHWRAAAGGSALILQGSRDQFGTAQDFGDLPVGVTVRTVPWADHEFGAPTKSPITERECLGIIADRPPAGSRSSSAVNRSGIMDVEGFGDHHDRSTLRYPCDQ